MRNRFPAACYRCGKMVEAGQGHFQKSQKNIKIRFASKWLTQHADCARKYFGTDHCYITHVEGFTDELL